MERIKSSELTDCEMKQNDLNEKKHEYGKIRRKLQSEIQLKKEKIQSRTKPKMTSAIEAINCVKQEGKLKSKKKRRKKKP